MTTKAYHSLDEGATPSNGSPSRKLTMETHIHEADPNPRISVTYRPASRPGNIKGHADVRAELASSILEVFGLSVVQHDPEKPAWVSYPQRAGRDRKKYFPIVKMTGALHEKICTAVLQEFERVMFSSDNRDNANRPVDEDESIPF